MEDVWAFHVDSFLGYEDRFCIWKTPYLAPEPLFRQKLYLFHMLELRHNHNHHKLSFITHMSLNIICDRIRSARPIPLSTRYVPHPTGHYSQCTINIEAPHTNSSRRPSDSDILHQQPPVQSAEEGPWAWPSRWRWECRCASTPPETHVLDVCRNEADTNLERILGLV
jgi:hypothetical protein